MRLRILLTGAGGRIGRHIRQQLAHQYDWVLTDKAPLQDDLVHPFYEADLTNLVALRRICHGVDTIVHCAAASQLTATWQEVLPSNIIGVYNILQAAVDAQCRRVIFASSYHTVYGYAAPPAVHPEWPVYPVTLYGASKVWGEAVAAAFAQQYGLSVICLRIGAVKQAAELRVGQAILPEVITLDDLIRLLVAAIEAPADLAFGCFHALSNNRQKRLAIDKTERLLGYQPQDDAFELARRNRHSWRWWLSRLQQQAQKLSISRRP